MAVGDISKPKFGPVELVMEPGIVHVVCVAYTWVQELDITALAAVQIVSHRRISWIRTLVLGVSVAERK